MRRTLPESLSVPTGTVISRMFAPVMASRLRWSAQLLPPVCGGVCGTLPRGSHHVRCRSPAACSTYTYRKHYPPAFGLQPSASWKYWWRCRAAVHGRLETIKPRRRRSRFSLTSRHPLRPHSGQEARNSLYRCDRRLLRSGWRSSKDLACVRYECQVSFLRERSPRGRWF